VTHSANAVAAAAVAIPSPKLASPVHLTPKQAQVWRDVTQRLPADQFAGDNAAMLEMYCQHVVHARRLAVEIEALRDKPLSVAKNRTVVAQLMRLHATETRCAAALAVKLGLALAARYDRGEQARNRREAEPTTPVPWESWRTHRADA
jgi:hypothetical protein